jgi:DNA-binding MurR/RpiR family transcriptional regulator
MAKTPRASQKPKIGETAARKYRVGEAPPFEAVRNNILKIHGSLAAGRRRMADFILDNPRDVVGMSVTEFAQATGVAYSYVAKFLNEIEVFGFSALRLSIAQSVGNGTDIIQEDLTRADAVGDVADKVFRANAQALADTRLALTNEVLQEAVDLLRAADFIQIYGIGSAATVAADAHYRLLRIGLHTRVEIDSHLMVSSAALTRPGTVVLTVSHSGSTEETLAATRIAKAAGAKVIVITGYRQSPLAKFADVVLLTVARETKFRTEAMSSRVAELSVIDALVAALALARHDEAVRALRVSFAAIQSKRQ